MAKAEISWRRTTEDGEKVQVYAQHIGDRWKFFIREKRYDPWQPMKNPPLEDWLELLDSVQRRITRRLQRPEEEARLKKTIRELFPEWKEAEDE